MKAASMGSVECLQIIAEKAPQTLAIGDKNGWTPAIAAAGNGNIDCLKFIAEKAPQTLSIATENGRTPAIAAAGNGKIDCLKFIAEKVPQTLAIADKNGWTPALCAVNRVGISDIYWYKDGSYASDQHYDEAIKKKAEDKKQAEECFKIIAEKAPESLAFADEDGNTPVMAAAYRGSIECLRIIVEIAPETLSITNKKGETAALRAAMADIYSIECLKFIAEKAPQTLIIADKYGNTPKRHIGGCTWKAHRKECLEIIKTFSPKSPKKWWEFWK